ncbi:hypothetical protein [Nostoc commune]|uniref:hypothetical protein n=1 Tax=Nostoc commune TaxID=1178 RepID=UPI0018C4A736|nr:hypothetical protein [Nostoc commune]MBG1257759.1 hypothetical protein [Nostoc commune BAE]
MKKVSVLIEKESAKFAQLSFFEFLGNQSIAFVQRLSFVHCFAVFVMGYSGSHSDAVQYYIAWCRGTAVPCPYGCTSLGRKTLYGNLNKYVWLEEATVDPIQYILNKQIREEENNWIWFLKDLEYFNFNLFLNFTDSLKFNWSDQTLICRQIIYELYRRTFQVNPIYRGRQQENCLLPAALVDKIFELFTALVDILVNFTEEYNIKQLLTRSFDGSDFAQLPCGKKATVGV